MKERLTGAIILVALLVLLVPELLTGPSRSAQQLQAPANADGSQMRSYTINLADDAAHRSATAPVTETPTPEAKPADPTASGASAQGSGNTDAGTAQPENVDGTVSHPSDPTGPSDPPQATAAGRAESAPAAQTEVPKPVPVAPRTAASSTRAEAPRASAAPPRAEAPPAARASEPPARESPSRAGSAGAPSGAGWAIQVGSFASRDNAERLARELKGKGFAATVSQSPKGRRLWRVRVGPETDRAAAVALGTKLRSAGQSGAVVPYP